MICRAPHPDGERIEERVVLTEVPVVDDAGGPVLDNSGEPLKSIDDLAAQARLAATLRAPTERMAGDLRALITAVNTASREGNDD
jgi:hypothetical protein